MSKKLKMQFNINECILGTNDDVVAIIQRKGKLYQMNFVELCGANMANFMDLRKGYVSTWLKDHGLGYLDV